MLKRFLKEVFKCRHKNAVLINNEGYCPDCGQYLKKNYYIVRCSCCKIKRAAKKRFEEISPKDKFCTNCGSPEFIIEKCEKLKLVDINYAIEVNEETVKPSLDNLLEIWVENPPPENADGENTRENAFLKNPPLPLIGEIKYTN